MKDEHETEVFTAAAERLNINGKTAERVFGVTRQTFASWMHGKTKVPHRAFVALLEAENKHAERVEFITETVKRISSPQQ